MRIQPILNSYKANSSKNTQFERNNTNKTVDFNSLNRHQYTGIPSVDLAYVSLFDNAIAQDLKLMGLI